LKSEVKAKKAKQGMIYSIGFFFLLVFALPAWAQDKGWEQEWQTALAAAKKEGTVVVAGSPDPVMRKDVLPKFTARFGIPVEFLAGRSSEIAARLKTEQSAGVYTVDILMMGIGTVTRTLYPEKMLGSLKPLLFHPESVDPSKWKLKKLWFVDPEERYVLRVFNRVGSFMFINTDYVKPGEIRAAKDLLDPKWRGKISTDDPTVAGTGANQAGEFLLQFGEEFLKRFYVDQKPGVTRDRRQISDWLARGTYPVCISCRDDDLRALQEAGFHIVEVFELADIAGRIGGSPWWLAAPSKLPHPNAAKIFANWMISKEALETYSRGYGSPTLRADVDESFIKAESIPRPGVQYFDSHDWKWSVGGREEAVERARKILKSAMAR
jgi:iron(III) transport system substrate-binding protein